MYKTIMKGVSKMMDVSMIQSSLMPPMKVTQAQLTQNLRVDVQSPQMSQLTPSTFSRASVSADHLLDLAL
jgi:hypothetical protein